MISMQKKIFSLFFSILCLMSLGHLSGSLDLIPAEKMEMINTEFEESLQSWHDELNDLLTDQQISEKSVRELLSKINEKNIPQQHVAEVKSMIARVLAKLAPRISQEQTKELSTKIKEIVATYANAIAQGAVLGGSSAFVYGGDISTVGVAMIVGIFQYSIHTTITLGGAYLMQTKTYDARLQFSAYQATRTLMAAGSSMLDSGTITVASPYVLGAMIVQDAITARLTSEYSQRGLKGLLQKIKEKSISFAQEVAECVDEFGRQMDFAAD